MQRPCSFCQAVCALWRVPMPHPPTRSAQGSLGEDSGLAEWSEAYFDVSIMPSNVARMDARLKPGRCRFGISGLTLRGSETQPLISRHSFLQLHRDQQQAVDGNRTSMAASILRSRCML